MGAPPFFSRSAVAVAQLLEGFDEGAILERSSSVHIEVRLNAGEQELEASACFDLLVRLLARLYPAFSIRGRDSNRFLQLSRAINPNFEEARGAPDLTIVVGGEEAVADSALYLGSSGWTGFVSTSTPQPTGESTNAVGAGLAACFATSFLFNRVFREEPLPREDLSVVPTRVPGEWPSQGTVLDSRVVLAGAGAVGQAAVWAMERSGVTGPLHVVDPETLELSNMQRYVLSHFEQDGQSKTELLREACEGLQIEPHAMEWADFIEHHGSNWDVALVGVDSARVRNQIQASLPRHVVNGWTQPGDLGVSSHCWSDSDACLSCLYLPAGKSPSEDKLVARALGLGEEWELEIRNALYLGKPPSQKLLAKVSESMDVFGEDLAAYAHKPLRSLYTEGICGGQVIPLDRLGVPEQDVHVPLAHQSALAGVLLAADLMTIAMGSPPAITTVTRSNVMRPADGIFSHPAQKDSREICLCQDADFRSRFDAKYA